MGTKLAAARDQPEEVLEPAWVKTWLPGASSRRKFSCENLVLMMPKLDDFENDEQQYIAEQRRKRDHRERTEASTFGYPYVRGVVACGGSFCAVDANVSFFGSLFLRDYEHQLEGAALAALRSADLVPEHVETRNLYSPSQPGIMQGTRVWNREIRNAVRARLDTHVHPLFSFCLLKGN